MTPSHHLIQCLFNILNILNIGHIFHYTALNSIIKMYLKIISHNEDRMVIQASLTHSAWHHEIVMTWKHFLQYWPFLSPPHNGAVIWSFDAFFVVSLNMLSSCLYFEMPWRSCEAVKVPWIFPGAPMGLPEISRVTLTSMLMWYHCNDNITSNFPDNIHPPIKQIN